MRRALVTGGSRGIGAAVCRALARDGFEVLVNYREREREALELAEALRGRAVGFDVSDSAAVDAFFEAEGPVDAVVANAGIALWKLFQDTTDGEWQRIFAVNTEGVFNVCRRAVPGMLRGGWGRIVTVSSMWGVRGASMETAYSASKAAVIGLTKALAKELGPSGITVNCVCPGVIDTDMNRFLDAETLEALREETPLGRLGAPEDVAETIAFFCSEKASFITGQVLSVAGGFAV